MVTFTQYLLPEGRRKEIQIVRSAEIEALAHSFIEAGGKYEAEILRTGEVSLTAHMDGQDIKMVLCANGPEIPQAVDRLVRESTSSIAGFNEHPHHQ